MRNKMWNYCRQNSNKLKQCRGFLGITGASNANTAVSFANGDGQMTLHLDGATYLNGSWYATFNGLTTEETMCRVNYIKRIECLCFKGDFEYRVHIQNSGWTDWTKADGVATLGTVGQALRIEAIQFR